MGEGAVGRRTRTVTAWRGGAWSGRPMVSATARRARWRRRRGRAARRRTRGSGGRRVAQQGCRRGDRELTRRGRGRRGGTAGQVDARAREQRQHQQTAEHEAGAAAEPPSTARRTAERGVAGGRAVGRAPGGGSTGTRRRAWGRDGVRVLRRMSTARLGVHAGPLRGRPLVPRDHENPCGRDTRGSAPDFGRFGRYGRAGWCPACDSPVTLRVRADVGQYDAGAADLASEIPQAVPFRGGTL